MNLKWGRRNSSSSVSSSFVPRPSLFSSWLTKLKKMFTSDPVPEPEHVHVKLKVNGKEKGCRPSRPSMSSMANGIGRKGGGRIYGGDEEAFWNKGFDGKKKSRGVDTTRGPMSSLTEEKKEKEIKTPRKGSMKFRRSMHRRVLEERLSNLDRELDGEDAKSTETVKKHVVEVRPEKTVQHCYNYNLKTNEEDHIHATPHFLHTNEVSELELKTKKRRKSYYISRELEGRRTKQHSKVRVQSPRPPTKMEICKVKALPDLKSTRLKTKKKTKKATSLESLAVVKCSFDPEKDFRESMMEMILEESINKPQELEELLACYLTLNADECHDLIIKVFRQVWLDMNKTCFQAEIHGEDGSYV